MAYSIKTASTSRNGLETPARFWSSHVSSSISDLRLKDSGIPLDVRAGKAVLSNPENHCMICAASGKGKTRRELYPTVIMSAKAGRSMVIADMKGEIYKNTGHEVDRCGYDIKIINLRDPSNSDRFSPLTLVQRYWNSGDRSRATILLKDICSLITAKIHSDKDMFWEIAAQDAIMGFGLLLLEEEAPLTFENIHDLFNEFFREKDMRENFKSGLNLKAESYKRLATVMNLDTEVTLSCILAEVNSALSCFVDSTDVRNLLEKSDIELTDIGRRPTAVYLMCPDESTALYGIASLFVEQCYSELINFADSRSDNRLPVKVDFILDEFGSFVGSDWPSKLTAARSRGIRFILAIQTMSQLNDRYGDNGARTIMANCRTLVFMGGRDMRLLSEISMLSGYRTDERTGLERQVLSINDLSTLKTGDVVILDDSSLPFIGHLPDWEEWGIKSRITSWGRSKSANHSKSVKLRDLLNLNLEEPEMEEEETSLEEDNLPDPWKLDFDDQLFQDTKDELESEERELLDYAEDEELPF